MSKQPYHDLVVWREAHRFTIEAYRLTKLLPKEEVYGLVSQLRRAAVSVEANIVEGHAKATNKDFLRFLDISKGSLRECAVLLELCLDLGYIKTTDYQPIDTLQNQVSFLLNKLILSIRSRS